MQDLGGELGQAGESPASINRSAMIEVLNLQHYYAKLARKEPVSEDDLVKLLKMASHFQQSTAYLAECHAATAEGLPASASKSSRGRLASICEAAVRALRGEPAVYAYPSRPDVALDRCGAAVRSLHAAVQAHNAKRQPKALNSLPTQC